MTSDNRDLVLKTKLLIPEAVWRLMTKPAAFVLSCLPDSAKYKFGLSNRKNRMPYASIEPGDVVFQIGAPRDLLAVGRSRAAYFLNLISGGGKLVVMEPDADNCEAMTNYARRNGLLEKLLVINAGGWNEKTELSFFKSDEHPASAVLTDLSNASDDQMARRGYTEINVPVTTVDLVISEHDLQPPKMISITTNGAELQILEGMKKTLKSGPEYISLAIDDDGYRQTMGNVGYDYLCDDDRGFTFKRMATK